MHINISVCGGPEWDWRGLVERSACGRILQYSVDRCKIGLPADVAGYEELMSNKGHEINPQK